MDEQARLTGLRELAEKALTKAGRREVPDSMVRQADYDLSTAPMPIQGLVGIIERLDVAEVMKEAINQWPQTSALYGPGFDHGSDVWSDEEILRARHKLIGYAAGLALGVTKLLAEPVTDVLRAAIAIGIDLAQRQTAARRAERLGINAAAKRDLEIQKKRKAQKKARQRQRR